MREPTWWQDGAPERWARALTPLAGVYAAELRRRLRRGTPVEPQLPVICIGNFTVGGAGKTPLALAVARLLSAHGHHPAFLTRGYGGREHGPHWVDVECDRARDVGDEPLLLARAFPTLVCRDRPRGAATIAGSARHDVIVMDDGLQNRALAKTFTIAVVDGGRGLGNRRVLPAGPLRAALTDQLPLVDAIVLNRGTTDDGEWLRAELRGLGKPLLEARMVIGTDCPDLGGRRVVSWTGIADPDRFSRTLVSLGARLVAAEALGDHRLPSTATATRLLERAARENAEIVTTEKDWLRLAGERGSLAELRERSRAVPVATVLPARDRDRLVTMLETAIGLGAATRASAAGIGVDRRAASGAEDESRVAEASRVASASGDEPLDERVDDTAMVTIRGTRGQRSV